MRAVRRAGLTIYLKYMYMYKVLYSWVNIKKKLLLNFGRNSEKTERVGKK